MCRFKKIWLVTFFLSTICSAVSQNDADSLKAFYPLHIGDLWQYEVNESGFIFSSWTTVVGDTVFENGDKYFVTEFNNDFGTCSQTLERVSESLEVLRYFDQALGSGDQLIYLLDARKGDSWISSDSMTVTTVTLGIGATHFRGGEGIVDFARVTLKGARNH